MAQGYPNFEHIIVDAGSVDGTLEILRDYSHLKWVSEPDRGQSDALNKAFGMSNGSIIVALNCDDYFVPDAFNSVLPLFEKGEEFVVGNVIVKSFRLGRSFRNVPRIGFSAMMRHWERNAYCYNPVGYFYTRRVQEVCPFNIENNFTMDLEFLLNAASKFRMVKINQVLGYYDEGRASKTTMTQADESYWSVKTFAYLERHINVLSESEQAQFRADRAKGYARMAAYWKRRQKIMRFREIITKFARRFLV